MNANLAARRVRHGVLGLVIATALAGCGGSEGASARPAAQAAAQAAPQAIDQDRLCEVSEWQRDVVAKACKAGQKVVYLPSSWGNDQLPVIFAAVNCDLRHEVVLTKGAVTCIYAPLGGAQQAS